MENVVPSHFEDIFIGRENRKSKYVQWSERAVVVGYNSENQSYDIVVTTEKLAGANKRTLNKTIRRVKSLIKSNVRTFLPGEAISVGYVDDKREHPIILGVGDNVVQTPVKVTLGPTLNVEGEKSIELTDSTDPLFNKTFCTDFLLDSLTGATNTVTLGCKTLDIQGCFEVNIIAPSDCVCGVYDWSMSGGGAGFTISDQGASASAVGLTVTLAPLGAGGSTLRICPPTNSGGFSSQLSHYHTARGQDRNDCDNFGTVCYSVNIDCDDNFLNSNGSDSFFCRCRSGSCPSGTAGSGQCATTLANVAACVGTGGSEPDGCGLPFCDSPGGFTGFVNFGARTRFGISTDCRTPAMISSGCLPCSLAMANAIFTATDACGRQTSIQIDFEDFT